MYLFPNGQNIQLLPVAPPPRSHPRSPAVNSPTNAISIEAVTNREKESTASEGNILTYLKDVAPHLNRQQRRAKAAELKHRAKSQVGELARKEIAKQNKEKSRG